MLKANNKVGVATAISANSAFRLERKASDAIQGVARNHPIGRATPKLRPKISPEQLLAFRNATKGLRAGKSSAFRFQKRLEPTRAVGRPPVGHEDDQRATTGGSYKKQPGNRRVLVGILDTGIDGNHPGIAANPTEGNNVISVSSIGPSKTKSDFSNWSYEETTVAAPGGCSATLAGRLRTRTRGDAGIPRLVRARHRRRSGRGHLR